MRSDLTFSCQVMNQVQKAYPGHALNQVNLILVCMIYDAMLPKNLAHIFRQEYSAAMYCLRTATISPSFSQV